MTARNSRGFQIPPDITGDTLPTFEEYADSYVWWEWISRKHLKNTAHAIDPDHDEYTGVRRSVNGARLPDHAKPAEEGTERDPFSLRIIEGRYMALKRKAEMNDMIAARRQAKEDRKNAKIAMKSPAAKKDKKSKKNKETHEEETHESYERIVEFPGGELRYIENRVEVHVHGFFKRVVEPPQSGTLELRVSPKSWQVMNGGKRVAFGRL